MARTEWRGLLAAFLASTFLCGPAMAVGSENEIDTLQDGSADEAHEEIAELPEIAMPALVLPSEDMEIKETDDGEDASPEMSDPSHYMISLIRGQLTDRYVTEDEIDAERIQALLSGDYIKDYAHEGDPVSFSNTIFDIDAANRRKAENPPAETPDPEPIPAPAGVDFLLSPAAIRAMSGMSPDQIEAIALMVEMMNNPEAAMSINPQLELKGIPSLSEQDLEEKSPEELLAHIASASAARAETPVSPPPVVDIGDGRIMALANWEMIISPDGRVEMSNATIPGSRFEVVPGVVVGQFGRVLDISVEEGNQFIAFESGDRLEMPHVPLDNGVPALDGSDESAMDAQSAEILVSGPVMRGDELLVAEADADGQAQPAVIRPKPKPEGIGKKQEAVKTADADKPENETSSKSSN